ncbi:MAG: ribonuclease P protein component [Alphaproteobacteria bacterium]|nr:ribonuclease P protein component [Alphaproteobacteria bacterium]
MNRLKSREDFLRAQKGVRRVTPSLTLEACASPAPEALSSPAPEAPSSPAPEAPSSTAPGEAGLRVGFTATKKLGNAVTRNRAKRRLRAAAQAALPLSGRAAHDYVLVARPGTLSRPFSSLVEDLAAAVRAAHLKLDGERK